MDTNFDPFIEEKGEGALPSQLLKSVWSGQNN